MLKRAVDIGVAALGLVLLSPLLALLALAIKLDSPGPVFFRQERIGRGGKPFRIFKFRTMAVVQPEGGLQITVAGDRRVTRVGAVLRRYKLDELPQLIDVLIGTMSLVGPRPEVARYVAHYPPEWRERLLSVRPGITDFASVRYHDEGTLLAQAAEPEREYIEVILPTKLRYALQYVDNPSLGQDLRVIGLTVRTVFAPSLQLPWEALAMKNSRLWPWLDSQMSALRRYNRRIAMAVDAAVVLACWHLTYLFRLGFERWQPGRPWYDDYVSWGVVLTYLVCMAWTGVPRGLWRFFGFEDLKRIALGCAVAGLISATVVQMAQLVGVARAVLLLHPLFCMLALSLVRMGYRMVWEHARSQVSGHRDQPHRAIVLGAGESGQRLVRDIHRRDGWTVLTLLDDDRAKHGLRFGGITVGGAISDLLLPHVLVGATHIILAIPSLAGERREAVLQMAAATGLIVLEVTPSGQKWASPPAGPVAEVVRAQPPAANA